MVFYPRACALISFSQLQKEIMASYDSSLTTSPNREAGFAPILSALLDPILQLIAAPTALSAADTAVYKINNLHYILNALTLYGFTGSRAAWLESQMEELEGHLVQHETRNMLVHSGMAGIVAAMDSNSEVPLALLPGMDHKSVVETMARLDNYLMSASFDGSPALMRLTSSRIARSVRKRAVDAFVAAYRRWHEAATDPKNKWVAAASFLAALRLTLFCVDTNTRTLWFGGRWER